MLFVLFVCLIEGMKLSPPLCEKILARTLVSCGWDMFGHRCGARRPIGAHQEYRWS